MRFVRAGVGRSTRSAMGAAFDALEIFFFGKKKKELLETFRGKNISKFFCRVLVDRHVV